MATVMSSFLTWVFVWLLVFGILFFIANWLTKGLVMSLLRVKGSRGRFILSRVYGFTDVYFRVCEVVDNQIVIKFRSHKDKARIRFESESLYNFIGVRCVDLHEAKASVIDQVDVKAIDGHDPYVTESLIKRALMKPPMRDNKLQVIIVLLILTMVFVMVATGVSIKILTVVNKLGVIA